MGIKWELEGRRMISMKGAKTKQPHFEEMELLPMSARKKRLHNSLDLALEGSNPDF
jgi:hypothetical protein